MTANNAIKILLIEDDPFLCSMYSSKFEIEGFTVLSADNGENGLDTAKREMPNLILLDIMLPRLDGFEVLKRLKSDALTANIPVIMLTNLNQKDEYEKGRSLGAVDFLVKAHYLPTEVVEKIKKA